MTHALIGWAIAHVGPTDRTTRLWCVIASVIPDVDGLGLLLGPQTGAYERFHHALAHNLVFGAFVTVVAARWLGRRPLPLLLVFLAFASHLIGDYFGSGPGWPLWPYWPLSDREYLNARAWPFVSWQNNVVGFTMVAIGLLIAFHRGRTPLEFVHEGLERSVVDALELRARPAACAVCAARATARCHRCRRALCPPHAGSASYRALLCLACRPPRATP